MRFMEHNYEYFVLIFPAVLSYFCGRLQANNTLKTEAMRRRYENFYVPFITHLYAGQLHMMRFSDLSLESRSIMFDLVMKNLQYLGPKSQACVPDFYMAFLGFLDYSQNPESCPEAPGKLDGVFALLTERILKESKRLSARLRMPDIGKTISTEYLQRYT